MAVQERERPEAETVGSSPARRLTVIQRGGLERHFQPTDPRIDLVRLPLVGRWLERAVKSRRFQFAAILPNQIIFWLVIATGLIGLAVPDRNFSTAITWYVWFCAVFVMMVGVGRAWCLIIVDPVTNAIKWQYGVKNSPGRTVGHLYIPDGLDFRLPAPAVSQTPKPGNQ